MADNQYAFPTEVLSLPSKGLLYPKDSPLSSGTIEVKYMTAKEEDILTSTNLIEKGLVIDKLLVSVIADPKVKLDDLLVGDKNALMLGTRVLGYGKDYEVTIEDPDTGLDVEHTFDLTKLETKKVDEKVFKSGKNKFSFTLPNSKRVIEFKLLTHKDERDIDSELKGLEKISRATGIQSQLTTRLKYQILSVDGDSKKSTINNFVDNEFLSRDAHAFRGYINEIMPDVDMSYTYFDENDREEKEMMVPMTISFLWPSIKS